MTKKAKITLSIAGAAILITMSIAAWFYNAIHSQVCGGKEYILLIDTDDNIDSLQSKLQADATGWSLLTSQKPMTVRTGRYAIPSGSNLIDTYRRIRNHQQDPMRLTIPEVRTLDQYPARIAAAIMIDSAAIAGIMTDSVLIDSLGFTPETIPAMFIPNTYEVWWNMSPHDFILRMYREWNSYWNDERRSLAKEIGLTPIEVATLASIVEAETANNTEKPVIAGLYINRLKKDILLQSDPTVIYAVGDFTIRRVLNKHLEVDNPYNTYKYAGLPPGPIRVPSIVGLEAVLHHAKHNYIYMCAKEDFSGTHNFAVTLSEHNANARRYINALNARGIKK